MTNLSIKLAMDGVNLNTRLVEITMLLSRGHHFKYATFECEGSGLNPLADHFCQHCHWESSDHDRLIHREEERDGGGEEVRGVKREADKESPSWVR